MAKAERHSNPFGWILLGALVGAIATAGVLLMASTMNFDRGYEQGPAEIRTAADDAAATAAARRTPVAAAPRPEAPPPVATVPAPAAAVEPPPVDAQMADDAAAAGMTSRAGDEHPTN
ncbi:hypothetical protein [Caulobacter sp. UNC279MFTsu5.1]|uniref:hypothetical protein n=1 Tax=Caulobacter sp. UNC279MFTsu5.1 TaxID=1502775 RepID=UPI0008EE0595|nr:hypothetical protein [Caulobacter sp. UNC279MFTsu5.1]SFJ24413.1 hypothetical protein SAMN02799626_01391 [Caulobacter sp. UNC279MFTsu5.1]